MQHIPERVGEVPADAQQDDFWFVVAPLESIGLGHQNESFPDTISHPTTCCSCFCNTTQMLAQVANGEADGKELPEQVPQLRSEEQSIPSGMIPVSSSNLASIGYISARKLLLVQFLSGGYYEYQDVTKTTFRAFLAAPSKGQFLNREIKPNYNYSSIPQKRVEILFSLSSLLGEKAITCDQSKLAQVEENLVNLLTAVG